MLAVAILICSCFASQEKAQGPSPKLWHEAPANSKDEDILKAGRAMQARCEGYGYKGISVKLIEKDKRKLLEFACETGFSEIMVARIEKFSQWPAATIEFKAAYPYTQAEAEQYQNPEYDLKAKAPPGSYWSRAVGANLEIQASAIVLLRIGPALATFKDFPKPKVEPVGKSLFFDVNTALRKKLSDKNGWYMVIDGYVMNETWLIEQRYEPSPSGKVGERVLVPSILKPPFSEEFVLLADNPMPFALKLVR